MESNTAELKLASQLLEKAKKLNEEAKYDEAIDKVQKSLEIRKRMLGEETAEVAECLNEIAGSYFFSAEYDKAELFGKQALRIREEVLGSEHPDTAESMNDLAYYYCHLGRYKIAEQFNVRALQIREDAFGNKHHDTIKSMNDLGVLFYYKGLYDKAEYFYINAIRMYEEILSGAEHPSLAITLDNLASIYHKQKQYSKAETFHLRALKMFEKTKGIYHTDTCLCLNNLGALYIRQGRYRQAELLLHRSLNINEILFGANHPASTLNLVNLGYLHFMQKQYHKSEEFYIKALNIEEESLGIDHPRTINIVSNLGCLYNTQKLYDKTNHCFLRSYETNKKVLGQEHPQTARSLIELSLFYSKYDKQESCIDLMLGSIGAMSSQLLINFQTFNEREKAGWLERNQEPYFHCFNFLQQGFPHTKEQVAEFWDHCLFRKGITLQLLAGQQNLIEEIGDEELTQKYSDMHDQKQYYSHIYFNKPPKMSEEIYQVTLTKLQEKIEEFEKEISRACLAYAIQRQLLDIKLSDVLDEVPESSVIVDFYKYQDYDYKKEKWIEWRYGAFLHRRNEEVSFIDFGYAKDIEDNIAELQSEMNSASKITSNKSLRESAKRVESCSRSLFDMLIEPLLAHLSGIDKIILCPDAELNLVPFEILMSKKSRYLYQDYDIQYLSSGKDLLRYKLDDQKPSDDTFVFADPSFGDRKWIQEKDISKKAPDLQDELIDSVIAIAQSTVESVVNFFHLRGNETVSLENLDFSPLPNTTKEAETIKNYLQKITAKQPYIYARDKATKSQFKQMKRPRILHIATHGFFLKRSEPEKSSKQERGMPFEKPKYDPNLVNPLLLSGLAFSNANRVFGLEEQPEKDKDGILTALEIAQMDLRGTELVVLSACETGLGEVKVGQGVYGLRRAFEHAGVRTIIMSLWKIPDRETAELMELYYLYLSEGKGKLESLRLAREEMRNRAKKRFGVDHPLFWAGFIGVGEN